MSLHSREASQHELNQFGRTWLDAWNSHDLEAILALYEDDFVFSSPTLGQLLPQSGGYLKGKTAARAYWSRAFAPGVNLRFESIAVLCGVGTVVIHYKGLRGKLCAEFFQIGASGKVTASHAHEYMST
jgi:ketosteroid isomerase-like protein